jgi:ketosteroid isomerase-like protein
MISRNPTLQGLLACIGLALIPFGTFAAQPGTTVDGTANETDKTAAAVIAVDHHWEQAEENGDASWLDGMLMPDYRSVGTAGTFASKAAIVGHAAQKHDAQAMKQKAADWHKTHPVEESVTMEGDTAILSFLSASPETKGRIYSSDIFVYVDGRWRALYSQHNAVGKD